MFKTKITILCSIIISLILIGLYHQNNLEIVQRHYLIEQKNHTQNIKIKSMLNRNLFIKQIDILFARSENPMDKIKRIVNLENTKIAQTNHNEFNIKFSTFDEQLIYEIIHQLQSDLNGISNLSELNISMNGNDSFEVDITLQIFEISEEFQKHFKVWNCSKAEDYQFFSNSASNKKYKLNGISHYGTAYINGNPYKQGQRVGHYKIAQIFDDYIILQSKTKSLKIAVDNCW